MVDNALQHTATHCNTLQHAATYTKVPVDSVIESHFAVQQAKVNALQHTAKHFKLL